MALFQKNDSSTKIANNIWNVIVKKWLNIKLLTSKEALILEKYTGLWIQQSDWLINCPRSVKTTFNPALKEGTRMISFAFMIPLNDIELNRFFYFLLWWDLNFHNLWEIYTAASHKNKFDFTLRVNLAQRHLCSIYA